MRFTLQVAESVGPSKTEQDCETLFRQHQGYLTLNVEYHAAVVFAAMVRDHFNTVPQRVRSRDDSAGPAAPYSARAPSRAC